MTEEAFSDDDAKFSRQERFRARREMIEAMREMSAEPIPMQIRTPKGVHKSAKLRAFVANQKFMQIGQQLESPPGTGSISGLIEEACARDLIEPNAHETQEFEVTGKPKLDYFEGRHIPKLSRHETTKNWTKK